MADQPLRTHRRTIRTTPTSRPAGRPPSRGKLGHVVRLVSLTNGRAGADDARRRSAARVEAGGRRGYHRRDVERDRPTANSTTAWSIARRSSA